MCPVAAPATAKLRPCSHASTISTAAPSRCPDARMVKGAISSSASRMVTQPVPQPRHSRTSKSRALSASARAGRRAPAWGRPLQEAFIPPSVDDGSTQRRASSERPRIRRAARNAIQGFPVRSHNAPLSVGMITAARVADGEHAGGGAMDVAWRAQSAAAAPASGQRSWRSKSRPRRRRDHPRPVAT